MPTDATRVSADLIAHGLALAAAVLALATVLLFINGCGDDDLVFPGQIPNTFTPAPATVTATPEDEDDEIL